MQEEKVLVIWILGLFIPTSYFTYIRGGSERHSRAREVPGVGDLGVKVRHTPTGL